MNGQKKFGLLPSPNDALVFSVALCSPFAQVINSLVFGPDSPISITLLAALPLAAIGVIYVLSRTQRYGWWLMFSFYLSLICIELARFAVFSLPLDPKGLVTYLLVPFIAIGFLKINPVKLCLGFIFLSLLLCAIGLALFMFYVLKNGMSLTTFGASLPLAKQDFNVGITLGIVGSLCLMMIPKLNRGLFTIVLVCLLVQLFIAIFILTIKSIMLATAGAGLLAMMVRGKSKALILASILFIVLGVLLNTYAANFLPENIQTLVSYMRGGNISGYDAHYIDTLWLRQQIIDINIDQMWSSSSTIIFGLGQNAAAGSAVTSPNSGLVTVLPRDVESGWAWFFFQFGVLGVIIITAVVFVTLTAYIVRRGQGDTARTFWAIAGGAMIVGNIAQDNLNLMFWTVIAGFISASGIGMPITRGRSVIRTSSLDHHSSPSKAMLA